MIYFTQCWFTPAEFPNGTAILCYCVLFQLPDCQMGAGYLNISNSLLLQSAQGQNWRGKVLLPETKYNWLHSENTVKKLKTNWALQCV